MERRERSECSHEVITFKGDRLGPAPKGAGPFLFRYCPFRVRNIGIGNQGIGGKGISFISDLQFSGKRRAIILPPDSFLPYSHPINFSDRYRLM